jgi:hypothetical protein
MMVKRAQTNRIDCSAPLTEDLPLNLLQVLWKLDAKPEAPRLKSLITHRRP